MQTCKNHLYVLTPLLLLTVSLFIITTAKDVPTSFCGKIKIQAPFLSPNLTESSSLLPQMIQCKSQKLYFRTSLGLFPISSINYTRKFLTISHPSCSSSSLNYVSPSLLSAGFPSPPQPNSLLLFNCSNRQYSLRNTPFTRNCTHLPASACGASSSEVQEQERPKQPRSCFLVDDFEKLELGFHPKDLNCSHYSHLYRSSSDGDHNYELGTRISFDIPDHVPNLCNECEKPNGNCGVGLRCVCHPNECKDKVISMGGSMNPFGNVLFSLLSLIVVIVPFLQL